MTPEFKTLHDALIELTGLLEADAMPDICIPKSTHIEHLLFNMHGEHDKVLVPGDVAKALVRMRDAMDVYRERWIVRMHAKTTNLQ